MKLPDIEVVSAKVHQEWIISKLSQGVRSRRSETGEELMVPYEQLSEDAKMLDRATVMAVYRAIEEVSGDWLGKSEAEIAKDTARLDYLDSLNQQLNEYHGTRYCWQVRRNHNRVVVGFDDMGVGSLTIREAIDRYQKDPEWGK